MGELLLLLSQRAAGGETLTVHSQTRTPLALTKISPGPSLVKFSSSDLLPLSEVLWEKGDALFFSVVHKRSELATQQSSLRCVLRRQHDRP
jgi:hypothetical protein